LLSKQGDFIFYNPIPAIVVSLQSENTIEKD